MSNVYNYNIGVFMPKKGYIKMANNFNVKQMMDKISKRAAAK